MIDPHLARAALKQYYATASDQQIVDDLWRYSPELARRLNLTPPGEARHARRRPGRIRGYVASISRSVLRFFS